MAKDKTEVPVNSLGLDRVQINQNLTLILNEVETTLAKVTTLLGNDTEFDGLRRELRRARDNAATQLGLVKDKNGNWGQA